MIWYLFCISVKRYMLHISQPLFFCISNSSPVDTQVCYPYTLITPWGYQTPDMDTKFNSARALSISKWLGYPCSCLMHNTYIHICSTFFTSFDLTYSNSINHRFSWLLGGAAWFTLSKYGYLVVIYILRLI